MGISRPVKSIIFDLDDTLLDTSGFLIPIAARESCQAMIDAGLNCDLETCLRIRSELLKSNPRSQIYRELTEKIGIRADTYANDVAFAGHRAFHSRNVEEDIRLREGAIDLLKSLQRKYRLILVTAGDPQTQKRKIELLKIAPYFEQIEIVDVLTQTKQQAFTKLQNEFGGTPFEYLSVGNRVDSDIAPAKRLGWQTCWVRYGEHVHMRPENAEETADFQIEELKDLPHVCSL